jgi:hypothetical protein
MPNGGREARVLDAVIALVDSLLDDFDVIDLLTELTERCGQLLDIESAGLLLADPRRQLHLMAATSDRTERSRDASGRHDPRRLGAVRAQGRRTHRGRPAGPALGVLVDPSEAEY